MSKCPNALAFYTSPAHRRITLFRALHKDEHYIKTSVGWGVLLVYQRAGLVPFALILKVISTSICSEIVLHRHH